MGMLWQSLGWSLATHMFLQRFLPDLLVEHFLGCSFKSATNCGPTTDVSDSDAVRKLRMSEPGLEAKFVSLLRIAATVGASKLHFNYHLIGHSTRRYCNTIVRKK